MKLRSPWIIRPLALLAAWLIRWWIGTVRYRMFHAGGVKQPADHRVSRYVYAFWHESILCATIFRARIRVLISQHADGEFITQVSRFLGYGVVRGSTTRGGTGAILEMHRASRDAHLGVTPDGPRGPRRRVQPGLIYLASITKLPIVVVGVGLSRAWRARSWDRFAIPKPWSDAVCVTAPAIHVPPRISREQLQHYIDLVEKQFEIATDAAERWVCEGIHPRQTVWVSAETSPARERAG